MASNANPEVDKLISYGQMAIEQGWYHKAREFFDQALELAPLNREAIKGFKRANEILRHKAPSEPVEVHQAEPISSKVRRWVSAAREWGRTEWKEHRDRVAEQRRVAAAKRARRAREIARQREERERRYIARFQRLNQLRAMSPRDFEEYTASLFKRMGYAVRITTASVDKGIDLFIEKDGRTAIVQCKRYKGSVGQPVVRDFYGTMIHNRVHEGYIVTTGRFSLPARNWARGKQIHLVDGGELVNWIQSLVTPTDETSQQVR